MPFAKPHVLVLAASFKCQDGSEVDRSPDRRAMFMEALSVGPCRKGHKHDVVLFGEKMGGSVKFRVGPMQVYLGKGGQAKHQETMPPEQARSSAQQSIRFDQGRLGLKHDVQLKRNVCQRGPKSCQPRQ